MPVDKPLEGTIGQYNAAAGWWQPLEDFNTTIFGMGWGTSWSVSGGKLGNIDPNMVHDAKTFIQQSTIGRE